MEKKKYTTGNILILLCFLLYTLAYLGRYSYNSNITLIISHFNISDGKAGIVTSCFFFAYGSGQIINGICCKYYNKRIVLFIALIVSAIINLAIFLGVPFKVYSVLWLINGLAQSFLWPSIVLALSEALEENMLKKSVVVMGATTSIGTIIAYGVSAFLSLPKLGVVNSFRYSFLVGAISLTIMAIVWLITYRQKEKAIVEENNQEQTKTKLDKNTVILLILLAIFAIIINLVKDGLSTWTPKILKTKFELTDSMSIFLTVILSVVGFFGVAIFVKLNKIIKSYVALIGVAFLIATIFTGIVLLFMNSSLWIVILLAFAVVELVAHGANSVVTVMEPMKMKDKINAGLLAGLLNGFCYVGSTISGYGLGGIADKFGWNGVFYLLIGLCTFALILSIIYNYIVKHNKKGE